MPDGNSLWGDLNLEEELITPLSILKKQASLLEEQTQGLVYGRVTTNTRGSGISHSLGIVAPALNGYEYDLLDVKHDIELYPASIFHQSVIRRCNDAGEFEQNLGDVLSSNGTHKIIRALVAQSR